MEKLRVVDLEQHPCDLAGEVRVLALKESVSNILSRDLSTWMRGKRRSPSICFCSCIGAAASIAVVSGSWILNNKSLNSCIFHLSWHNNAALLSAGLHRGLPMWWQRVPRLLKRSFKAQGPRITTHHDTHLSVLVLLWAADHPLVSHREPLHALSSHHGHCLSVHPLVLPKTNALLLLNHSTHVWTGSPRQHHARHHASHVLPHAHGCSDHAKACTCAIGSCHVLLLLRPPWMGRSKLSRRIKPLCSLMLRDACWHQIASHAHLLDPRHLLHALHTHASHPLDVLACQMRLPVLLPLCQRHVERLRHDDPSVHLCHCLRRLVGRREANKTKALTIKRILVSFKRQ